MRCSAGLNTILLRHPAPPDSVRQLQVAGALDLPKANRFLRHWRGLCRREILPSALARQFCVLAAHPINGPMFFLICFERRVNASRHSARLISGRGHLLSAGKPDSNPRRATGRPEPGYPQCVGKSVLRHFPAPRRRVTILHLCRTRPTCLSMAAYAL